MEEFGTSGEVFGSIRDAMIVLIIGDLHVHALGVYSRAVCAYLIVTSKSG